MRFLQQSLDDGTAALVEGAAPSGEAEHVLVRSLASVVSSGTERMLADFGRASYLGKARQQPERVRDVVDKARTDGLLPTVDAVRSKLASPLVLGYANCGVIVDAGGCPDLSVGQLVASNGSHAEVVAVPKTLCAAVPDGVPPDHAALASIASVGLQGIRLAQAEVGERFVVTGLGLIGLLTTQLLRAQGVQVLGIDVDPTRLELAAALGAEVVEAGEGVLAAASRFGRGRGVDGVIITASTKSSEPVRQAAQMSRQKGRVVLVGVTGLDLQRADFYEKELSFQVSCSYGPGRYDPVYEGGRDYPYGHVRWTAGRNMEAVLDLMSSGALDVGPLLTHEYPFDDAVKAYDTLVDDPTALGIVLRYPTEEEAPTGRLLARTTIPTRPAAPGSARVAFVGAGSYSTQVLIPAVREAGAELDLIASRGPSAAQAASRFSARRSTTDLDVVFEDQGIDTVVVATRHDSHANLVERSLRSGKHVFVEKPLAITGDQLDRVVAAAVQMTSSAGGIPLLGIGFNRRFAPVTKRMRELLATIAAPKAVLITVNAGSIPATHWTQDPAVGGGRIVGEACHFIDLARHLTGSPIVGVETTYIDSATRDSAMIVLAFEDGSSATIAYLAEGSKRFPKERVEVFAAGRVLVNDNFRTLHAYGWPGVRTMRLRRQDKGHTAGMAAFIEAVRTGGSPPIPFDEVVEVSRAALQAAGST
ncbi:Gfo/Idh/MocA family oxidoreductase [Iamia sp. SCSIO 61187]|uniref:bi-domain-containing oxidoreductase n=1 Tax=Iamia sp. SCSIO 61187 TaxID=2722752 RepID=UPI001C6371E6|nr:bi-domain-containing oxidoreductase [Iamia sp. SCSIO 61187]QYG92353.1 Gfo/Idh/MocA family oxidoreductase [Iamia sp. SCSIO 61187]